MYVCARVCVLCVLKKKGRNKKKKYVEMALLLSTFCRRASPAAAPALNQRYCIKDYFELPCQTGKPVARASAACATGFCAALAFFLQHCVPPFSNTDACLRTRLDVYFGSRPPIRRLSTRGYLILKKRGESINTTLWGVPQRVSIYILNISNLLRFNWFVFYYSVRDM